MIYGSIALCSAAWGRNELGDRRRCRRHLHGLLRVRRRADDRIVLHKVPSTPGNPAEAVIAGLRELGARHGIDLAAITRLVAWHDGRHQCADPAARRQGRAGRHRGLPRPDRDRPADPAACVRPAGGLSRRRWCRANCASRRRSASPRTAARCARSTPRSLDRAGGSDRRGAKPDACAVCLLFSFLNPAHEAMIRDALARRLPGHVPLDLVRGAAGIPRIRAALHDRAQRLSAAGAWTAISATSPTASPRRAPTRRARHQPVLRRPDVG